MRSLVKTLCCGAASLALAATGVPVHANGSTSGWQVVASVARTPLVEAEATNYIAHLQSAVAVRGGFEAQMLQATAREAAALATVLPDNTPWVVGRYSPETAQLRVDLYRVERRGDAVLVLTRPFGPGAGQQWADAGAYISASARAGGGGGLNPFAAFGDGGNTFVNISFDAARVVMGHAVRWAQAPVGVMAYIYTDLKHQTSRGGNAFRRTYTTEYWGRAVTRWYVGYPSDFGAPASALSDGAYCVNGASGGACAAHEVARSALAFEEWTGGHLNDGSPTDAAGNKTATGELVYYNADVKKGWTLLGMLTVGWAFSFGSAVQDALSNGLSARGLFEMAAAGVGSSTAMAGYASGLSAASGLVNGADLGTPVDASAGTGFVDTAVGISAPVSFDVASHQGRAMGATALKALAANADVTPLSAVRKTLVGDCPLSVSQAACTASSGVLTHGDQLAPVNLMRVWREGARPLRPADVAPPIYGTD